jgi:hypothetical protein
MGQSRTEIDSAAQAFIQAQRMFFVASAPLAAEGRINLSPKGLDTFRILSPKTVGYLDFTGSGVETIAHIRENRRLTIMFCSFEGSPNILRLYGRGHFVEPSDPDFAAIRPVFAAADGVRAIILLDVERVTDSCGFGVPLYEFKGHRDQMGAWARKKGPDGIAEYQRNKNARSLDGLPGLRSVHS